MAPNNTTANKSSQTATDQFKSQVFAQHDLIDGNKFLESNSGMRSFFMQIDSIFYEREKHCNYSHYNSVRSRNESELLNVDALNARGKSVDDDLRNWSNSRTKVKKKRLKSVDTSSSSSDARATFKSRPMHKRVSSARNQRDSLRNKHQHEAETERNFLEYKPKSSSLLIGGVEAATTKSFSSEPLGSHGSLKANTAATTLTNVSMTSLTPFQVTSMPKHNIQVRNLKAKWNNVNRDVIFILYEIYNKAKRLRHNISTQALKEYDVLTDQIIQSVANNQTQLIYQSQQNINNTLISKTKT